jgi:hypothetical protein
MPERPSAAELARLDPDGSFAGRLARDRADLAGLAEALAGGAGDGRDHILAEIEVLAHRLAGAAGTFGHAEVGAAAFDLEEAAIALRRAPSGGRAALDGGLRRLLGALDGAAPSR